MQIKKQFINSIFFIFLSFPIAENNDNYYSINQIIEYADYLFGNEEYQMAIGEYQRALYLVDNNVKKIELKNNIADCYKQLGKIEMSISLVKSMISESKQNDVIYRLRYKLAQLYFEIENYFLSEKYLNQNILTIQDSELLIKNQLLLAATYILQNQINRATSILNSELLIKNPISKQLSDLIQKKNEMNKKNPHFAAMLSALIPGAGKVYSKNINDGLYSMFSVLGTGYVTHNEIKKGNTKTLKFFTFCIISTTFYLGNIYGSYIESHLYNKRKQQKLIIKIKEYLEI